MDNLARDVKEALRLGYGVHYGNYKVDHPHTRDEYPEEDPPPKHPPRNCRFCGEEFLPTRGDQIYCTEECRNLMSAKNREHKRKTQPKVRPKLPKGPAVCPVCGESFYRTSKSTHKVCCSRSCAAKLRNRQLKEQKTKTEGGNKQ